MNRRPLAPYLATRALALLLLIFIFWIVAGCTAMRQPATPGAPATPATPFENLLVWNAAIAETNNTFASNVIALEKQGVVSKDEARNILRMQGAIAQADLRITADLRQAGSCSTSTSGATATASLPVSGDAAVVCLKPRSVALQANLNLILNSVANLNSGMLLGIKDDKARFAIGTLLASIQNTTQLIFNELRKMGVIQ